MCLMFEHMPPIYALSSFSSSCSFLSSCWVAPLSSSTCQFSCVSLTQSHKHTHSSVMSLYNPCYICTSREWKWHIKNRFFISCQEEEWTHRQTWHLVWCQYPATNSSLWHRAPISSTEKHICHFVDTGTQTLLEMWWQVYYIVYR